MKIRMVMVGLIQEVLYLRYIQGFFRLQKIRKLEIDIRDCQFKISASLILSGFCINEITYVTHTFIMSCVIVCRVM